MHGIYTYIPEYYYYYFVKILYTLNFKDKISMFNTVAENCVSKLRQYPVNHTFIFDTCVRKMFGVSSCNGYWHQTEGLRKIPHGSQIVILY